MKRPDDGRRTLKMRSARSRRSRKRIPRLSGLSINRMVPNVLTLLALCAGMTLYLWTLSELHGLGWAIALLFAVCCALRLARFNTETSSEAPSYAAPYFTGAPAPAGAGLVMVPMFLSFEWGDWLFRSAFLNAVTVTGIALLMISKVPTVSLKRIRIPHHLVVPTLLGFGMATAFLTTEPWLTLTAVGIVYVSSIPLTIRSYLRLKRAAQARKTEAAEKPEPAPLPSPPPFPLGEAARPPNEWRH